MSNPYNFSSVHPDIYDFRTSAGVEYQLYFTSWSNHFQDYPEIEDDVKHFGFEMLKKPNKKVLLDTRVGDTIGAILKKIFLVHPRSILIFMVDNQDGKHLIRKRKFESWFLNENNGTIEKLDGQTGKPPSESYFSILFRGDHPYKSLILDRMGLFKLTEATKP